MDLIQYIESKIKLNADECAAINTAFKKEFYPKGTNLVQPDNRSQKIYFVEDGLIRLFYINQDGKDITHFFFGENNFTMSVENVYFNNPDPNNIKKAHRKVNQAQALIAVAQKALTYRQEELKIQEDKQAAGLNKSADLLNTKALLAKAHADMYSAQLTYRMAISDLNILTGK